MFDPVATARGSVSSVSLITVALRKGTQWKLTIVGMIAGWVLGALGILIGLFALFKNSNTLTEQYVVLAEFDEQRGSVLLLFGHQEINSRTEALFLLR